MRTPIAFATGTVAAAGWAIAPLVARRAAHRVNRELIRRGYPGDLGDPRREGEGLTRTLRIATTCAACSSLLVAVTDFTSL